MKCFCSMRKFLSEALKRIHLVDRCLIVFMAILLAQSAYNLFSNAAGAQDISNIDVIVRTSAAAIFGYFISGNFINRCFATTEETPDTTVASQRIASPDITVAIRTIEPPDATVAAPRLPIGLPLDDIAEAPASIASVVPPDIQVQHGSCRNLQIIVVAIIGITSLCALLIFRNFFPMSPSAISTISQLRDFVSGCVGFMIGCPTDGNN